MKHRSRDKTLSEKEEVISTHKRTPGFEHRQTEILTQLQVSMRMQQYVKQKSSKDVVLILFTYKHLVYQYFSADLFQYCKKAG